jgi:hypothetical protein
MPLLRWSLRESKNLDGATVNSLPDQNAWHVLKTRYTVAEPPPALPSGWTRWPVNFAPGKDKVSLASDIDIKPIGSDSVSNLVRTKHKFPPRYYYTHKLTGSSKFCYPVPMRESQNEAESPGLLQSASVASGRYLCTSTHRAFFNIEIQDNDDDDNYEEYCELSPPEPFDKKKRAGRLWPDEPLGNGYKPAVLPLELVVISAKYIARGGERWEQPFGEESPQLYNVLWVEWLDGVAYRRGVGEVEKDIWDAKPLELIELILG